MKKKIFAACLVICLLATAVIGTTLAYFTDETDAVTNTFTMGKVEIELAETTGNNYKMVPGATITKDPEITVKDGSEPCYVFIKVQKQGGLEKYVDFSLEENWTAVSGVDNLYYTKMLTAADSDVTMGILKNDTVTVKSTVTGLEGGDKPELVLTGYAVQADGFETAEAAWTATFGA